MLIIATALASGILIDGLTNLWWPIYALTVVPAVAIGVADVCRSHQSRPPNGLHGLANVLLPCLGFAALGGLYHSAHWNWYEAREIGRIASDDSEPVALRATMLTELKQIASDHAIEHVGSEREDRRFGESRFRCLVRCEQVRDLDQWIDIDGQVMLTVHGDPPPTSAGDQIQLIGAMSRIAGPDNPGQYDFASHYRRQRVLVSAHCYQPLSIRILKPSAWQMMSRLRKYLDEIAWRYLGPSDASLASAILLGNRNQISPNRRTEFLKTGTIHLLAISGLHVGILAGLFYVFFRAGYVSRHLCLLLTIVFVLFYAWLVEFRPPVVRATIFIVLFCLSRLLGRLQSTFNILAAAAIIVLAINPSELFSLGSQLSFLAVTAIAFGRDLIFHRLTDPLERLIRSTRPPMVRAFYSGGELIRATFMVSFLVWIISIPIVAATFHVIAPIGLLVNPILLLPISVALYGGLAMFALGGLFSTVTRVAAAICSAGLVSLQWVVSSAAEVPYGHLWLAGPSAPAVVVFYVVWIVFGIYPPLRLSYRKLMLLGLAWLVLGWWTPAAIKHLWRTQVVQELRTTFIDIGHGSAVLLELPDGRNVMYDCGSTSNPDFAVNTISGVLWSRGITHLDAIIFSHADIDHYSGAEGLLERFGVDAVYLTDRMRKSSAPSVQQLLTALDRYTVVQHPIEQNAIIPISPSVSMNVIAPDDSLDHSNDNSASVVLTVTYRGRTILLPGDLEREGLDRMLAGPPINCDLLMAAHHGSNNSRPDEFLKWATPQYVAISCGRGKLKESAKAAFDDGCRQAKDTSRFGAITFTVANDGEMALETWHQD